MFQLIKSQNNITKQPLLHILQKKKVQIDYKTQFHFITNTKNYACYLQSKIDLLDVIENFAVCYNIYNSPENLRNFVYNYDNNQLRDAT